MRLYEPDLLVREWHPRAPVVRLVIFYDGSPYTPFQTYWHKWSALQLIAISGLTCNNNREYYFTKVVWTGQKPRVEPLSRPRRPFWGPLAPIFDFAGCAALQAVSECPRRR